ncbi:MAG: BolA family transcriptional regulator [Wolbachia endosymbiont of Meromenopon meropis]|nr:BolA family transcriptional regulator [Wolbachia endosymbiont of Meromenopon meropis]
MSITKVIEKKIRCTIDVIDINIVDESFRHKSHHYSSLSSKSLSHVKLVLISDNFVEMNVLERHKLIYKLLKDEIKQLHAISLQLYTQNEYNLKKINNNIKRERRI